LSQSRGTVNFAHSLAGTPGVAGMPTHGPQLRACAAVAATEVAVAGGAVAITSPETVMAAAKPTAANRRRPVLVERY
jgi:hypothetical protein